MTTPSIKAWHGSPHIHDSFSLQEVGTGEDALNYGWGIYFSEKPDVAMTYRDGLAGKSAIKGGALYEVELRLGKADLLDWDLPIAKQSEKVQQAIQKAIDRHADPVQKDMMAYYAVQNGQKAVGGTFYRTLASMFGDGLTKDGREEASRFLLSLGIPGIRYLDAFNRTGDRLTEKTLNYVIFDDSLVKITTRHAGGMQVAPDFGAAGINIQAEYPRKTDTTVFRKWFRDSKVVDENGKPRTMYHGTNANFEAFKTDGISWFSSLREDAEDYNPTRIIETYLSISNPADLDNDYEARNLLKENNIDPDDLFYLTEDGDKVKEILAAVGYDGLVADRSDIEDGVIHYAAFNPEQIEFKTINCKSESGSSPR